MSGVAQPAAAHGWIARHGWLMAAVWLVFLAFPVLAVVSDDTGRPTKIAAIALMALFSIVYVDGFRRQGERESQALSDTNRLSYDWVADGSSGAAHFAVMIALAVVTYAVAGHAALGMTPYVVALAVFHFTWPMAWAVAVAGVVVNLAVPAATSDLDVLWFYAIIAASVGASTLLIRAVETNQFEQAQLRTRLALSDERGRVARDVHDVLGHSLTAMILKTELCRRLLDGVEAEDQAQRARLDACRAQLEELESVGRSALAEIRSTVGGLRAADLADELTVARSVLVPALGRLLALRLRLRSEATGPAVVAVSVTTRLAVRVRPPATAVTTMVRLVDKPPMPTSAVTVPFTLVTVPLGAAVAPLSTVMVTPVFGSTLRLASSAVTVAVTCSAPVLTIVGELSVRMRSEGRTVEPPVDVT